MKYLLMALFLLSVSLPVMADNTNPLAGQVTDPLVEAQERLLHAKGNYKTIKQQEIAIEDMRKATRLSLKAAKLRAKAEKLQTKADLLVNKANQQALSRGVYITSPLSPVMMQAPPVAEQPRETAPVPGNAINIVLPKQEEVSDNGAPPVPTLNSY